MNLCISTIQFFRCSFVGVLTNLTGYSLYLLLTSGGFSPKIVMSFLYMAGVIIGFFANRTWTFRDNGNVLTTGMRYILTHTLGYLLNLSLLIVMVDYLGYPHQWVQILAVIIMVFFLFLMFKLFVFNPPHA